MKSWLTIASFVGSTALATSLLAWYGLPYSPLSSLSGLDPYVRPGPTGNLEQALVTTSHSL